MKTTTGTTKTSVSSPPQVYSLLALQSVNAIDSYYSGMPPHPLSVRLRIVKELLERVAGTGEDIILRAPLELLLRDVKHIPSKRIGACIEKFQKITGQLAG